MNRPMHPNKLADGNPAQDTVPAAAPSSRREVVEQDLQRLSKQEEIRNFRGKLTWHGDLTAMRTDQ